MRVRHVDRCQLRRNFATQFAIDSPVVVANDLDGKSMENRSKIAFECGSAPNSASKSILGAFLAPFSPLGGAFGSFWVTLGDPWGSPGRPWGAPGVPWEALGPPPGLPGDPPGTHLGPSWAPWASRGGSGRVLASQNHEKSIDFSRFLHQFSVPKSVANLVVCAPMLVPKSLSKRVWPSILGRWLRRFAHISVVDFRCLAGASKQVRLGSNCC